MKVAKLYNFHDIRIEDMPVPEPGNGDVLVRVKACGICSGDVMPWYIEKKAPLVIGHEPSGIIVKKGESVKTFQQGDRIFFHHHAPCFNCNYCKKGDYVQCSTWRDSRIHPGGLSEFALIPEVNILGDTLLLPDTVSFEQATLVEPVACVVKGLKRAAIRNGDTVLVMGLGVMGQIHIMLARKFGAGKIIGADSVPYRLKKALTFGADTVVDIAQGDLFNAVDKTTGGGMADIVVVGPGTLEAMSQGISCTGRGGKVIFFTPAQPGDILQIQPNALYFKDISIITSYSCGPDDTKAALQFICDDIVNTEALITHRFPLEKTSEAFHLTAETRDSLKVIITL
ncbi:sorbitol dehydrogenase [bacterium]|nr:MAG: sorbitol dehydrogenase [bacterium]